MGTVDIDVNRILKGGYLYELHFIAGQTTQFKELDGKGIDRKLPDNCFIASFQMCNGEAQYLFRLILINDKNTGIWGLPGR
jgi:hypothetical protein